MSATGFILPTGQRRRLRLPVLPDLGPLPEIDLQRAVSAGDIPEVMRLLDEGVPVDPFEAIESKTGEKKACMGALCVALHLGDRELIGILKPHANLKSHFPVFFQTAVRSGLADCVEGFLEDLKNPVLDLGRWMPESVLYSIENKPVAIAWESILRSSLIHWGDFSGVGKSEQVFDLVWDFVGQCKAHDLFEHVRIPRKAADIAGTTRAPDLLPHVWGRIWEDCPSPNLWFALFARGEFDTCERLLPDLAPHVRKFFDHPSIQHGRFPTHGIPEIVAGFVHHPEERAGWERALRGLQGILLSDAMAIQLFVDAWATVRHQGFGRDELKPEERAVFFPALTHRMNPHDVIEALFNPAPFARYPFDMTQFRALNHFKGPDYDQLSFLFSVPDQLRLAQKFGGDPVSGMPVTFSRLEQEKLGKTLPEGGRGGLDAGPAPSKSRL